MCFKWDWSNLIYLLTLLRDNLWSTLNFVSSNEKLNQLQTVIWAMNVSRLVKTRNYCCRNKIAFRKQELFFKTAFAILRNTGFCLLHMQAKKRKHIGNNEETVTLNIWYGKFSHLYAVTTPTKIQSKCKWGLLNLATDLYLGSCLHCHRSFCELVPRVQKPK